MKIFFGYKSMCVAFVLGVVVLSCVTQVAVASPVEVAIAENSTIDVWPAGKVPGQRHDISEREVTDRGDGVIRITDVSEPSLALFLVDDRTADTPTVLVCPGGGYRLLAYNKEGTDVAAWLNSKGINAVVLKYRVPGDRTAAFQDVQRTMRVIRSHASDWGIDSARIGVLGFSAGGHLAARLSTGYAEEIYERVDEVDDFSSRPDFSVLVYPAYLNRDDVLAPEFDLSADIPPTLLIHSEDDTRFNRGTKLYDAALENAKISHRFILYSTGGHGYGLNSDGEAREWPQRAIEWIKSLPAL